MDLYSNKQRWKIFLLLVATVIVGITLWYSNFIAKQIETEERQQIELWSTAIKERSRLVVVRQQLFESLKDQERKDADLLGKAYAILADLDDQSNLTFVADFIFSKTSIPILMYDKDDKFLWANNIPGALANDTLYIDSLKTAMSLKNAPIEFDVIKQKLYYDDSYLFTELQSTMEELINSFISETVINSASVPVIMTDSTLSKVIRIHHVDSADVDSVEKLRSVLDNMADQNERIEIELPGRGTNYIYFENSLILTQLKYFPVIQLTLVAVFLLIAYLIFSTFRKAEQNQVWVGMAKETAHQLGTPLSSLMAWMDILESRGVDKDSLVEINKDVKRLEIITNRFSKIGSEPKLEEEYAAEVVRSALGYLSVRVSKRVEFREGEIDEDLKMLVSRPLFGWVLENLIKNAVDAMGGEGVLTASVTQEGNQVAIDIEDTGKGIPKNKHKTVFQPGYTTKRRGWGLGLSLTKRIIENYHNGKIYVKRSEAGVGTTFRILLDRA
jgi:two-component system, sporulation sensor kinase D